MLTLTSHPRLVPSTSQGSFEDNIVNKISSSQNPGSPFSQDGLKDNISPQRQFRQLAQRILRQKVTKNMVRKAIKLYDLEKDYTSQSPEALSELERLFKINDIEWPSEDHRMAVISEKVSVSLKRTLRSYGYVIFFPTLTKIKPRYS
jgi:hypothetical protein